MKAQILIYFLFTFAICKPYCQLQIDEDFSIQTVTSEIQKPNGLIFDAEGRMLVWEKVGLVWLLEDGKLQEEPILDLREEVMSNGDLGLLSLALDPNFTSNGFLYAYYSVDYHHLIHYGTDLYDENKSQDNRATIGRVSRFTLDDFKLQAESRTVILGKTISTGIPIMHNSHVGGTLLFGDDGTLLLSIGDCETWEGNYVGDGPPYFNSKVEQALEDGIIRPEEEVGTMRSQMINSYSGKVIRFDATSGAGIPSNPFYDEAQPDGPASKVWALGFRNPFRMSIRQGSGSTNPNDGLPGTLFVGEVGAASWEELNIITEKGLNFGWPIIEGNGLSDLYDLVQTNKDVINPCDGKPVLFRDLVKLPHGKAVNFPNPCDNSTELPEDVTFICELPALNLAHITVGLGVFTHSFDDDGKLMNIRIEESDIDSDVGLIRSNAAIAGPTYAGNQFPEEYIGDLFITDFANGWIARVELDLNEEVQGLYSFYKDTFKIKHLAESPVDGCIYLIENRGHIRKICYDVNVPPIVDIKLSKNFGTSPLTIDFNASQSVDPEGEDLTFEWDFGNGTTSTSALASSTFSSSNIENFTVKLTVTDSEGASSSEEVLISLNNSPPSAKILGIQEGDPYSLVGLNHFSLKSEKADEETGEESLTEQWSIFLHHNTHFHKEEEYTSSEIDITIPPVGCGNEVFYYRVKLEVKDPQGLATYDEVNIYPDCANDFANLLSFKAGKAQDGVQLDWEVDEVDGLSKFVLLRQSFTEENEYQEIHRLAGQLVSGAYEFLDHDPVDGPNYYTLRLDGERGPAAYSETRKVIFLSKGIVIFPNPMVTYFDVLIADLEGEAVVEIYDSSGKFLEKHSINGAGETMGRITPSLMDANGIYTIVVKRGESIVKGQMMIKHKP